MAPNTWSKDYFKYDPAQSKTERGKVLIINHNKKVDDIDLAMQYGDMNKLVKMLTITEHSPKNKMADKHSISTSVALNDFCKARQCLGCRRSDGAEPVCPYCFAEGIGNARPTVKYATARNSMILWQNEIPVSAWETRKNEFLSWNQPDFRIQSLGDVRTVTEAENYIRLEMAIQEMIMTEWSKNWRIWLQAFNHLGKPKNSRYIHSSLYLNHFDPIPEAMVKYTDFRFTVFTEEYLQNHPELHANCCTLKDKHRKCRYDCNDCYSKHPEECEFDRIEIVRGYNKQ